MAAFSMCGVADFGFLADMRSRLRLMLTTVPYILARGRASAATHHHLGWFLVPPRSRPYSFGMIDDELVWLATGRRLFYSMCAAHATALATLSLSLTKCS